MSDRILRKRKPLGDITLNGNNLEKGALNGIPEPNEVAKPKKTRASFQPVAIEVAPVVNTSVTTAESVAQVDEIKIEVEVSTGNSAPRASALAQAASVSAPAVAAAPEATVIEAKAVEAVIGSSSASRASSASASADLQQPVQRRCVFKDRKNPDPLQCTHLLNDLYDYYYTQETVFATHQYMSIQEDINNKMRSILVDWLVEVHHKFKLSHPTLWLCINILDRYLSKVVITRNKLQLVGVASFLIACKFEEVSPPEIKDCIYITDYAYQKEELVAMEANILMEIDYQVFVPTGFHFLDRYLNSITASARTRNLAFYYAERFLQESDSLDYLPHQIACAATYCALRQQRFQLPAGRAFMEKALSLPCWGPILQMESGVQEADIVPLATIMMTKVCEEPETASKRKLVAAKKKYTNEKYLAVALLPVPVFN